MSKPPELPSFNIEGRSEKTLLPYYTASLGDWELLIQVEPSKYDYSDHEVKIKRGTNTADQPLVVFHIGRDDLYTVLLDKRQDSLWISLARYNGGVSYTRSHQLSSLSQKAIMNLNDCGPKITVHMQKKQAA